MHQKISDSSGANAYRLLIHFGNEGSLETSKTIVWNYSGRIWLLGLEIGLVHNCTTAHEQTWSKLAQLIKHHGKPLNSTRYKKPWNNYVGFYKRTLCTSQSKFSAVTNKWVSRTADLALRLQLASASDLCCLSEHSEKEQKWRCSSFELFCPVLSEAGSACLVASDLFLNLPDRVPPQNWNRKMVGFLH